MVVCQNDLVLFLAKPGRFQYFNCRGKIYLVDKTSGDLVKTFWVTLLAELVRFNTLIGKENYIKWKQLHGIWVAFLAKLMRFQYFI